MKKRMYLTALALLLIQSALLLKAETVQYLVLTQNDREVAKFALTDAPVLTFSGSDLVVTCAGSTLSTNMAGLKTSFEDVSLGIREIEGSDEARPSLAFGQATFEGLKPGATVAIYTLDGKTAGSTRADATGRASVSLAHLGRGVYILRTPSRSYKIKN